ncbi:UDP-N-acetylmuramoyl-tripeptide--D-alanyl-D-alanine ligase [Streptomyces sp. NPDC057257]|uniref:UDP-N-acetylmuramoyl-tripeptide--D-alanyl-D- alanine ligase n=1 Tax=Streptomyces sp. NPDC057257 TaxID=3346071 RepID=UPI003628696E
MHPISLTTLAFITGGRLVDVVDPDAQITQPAVFDSREAVPGSLFLALKGANGDGHAFAAAAIGKGAVAALVTHPVGVPAIVVDDVLTAMGCIGNFLLHDAVGSATVVAVTGSAGKTSTKDLIAQVLPGNVVATPQSFNNEIGLPITVTLADQSTDYLVLEMGARHIGDIRELTRIAEPDISVVTNVGTAHVGEFGSRENIARAKGEIVEALQPGGLAVLNCDDEFAREMMKRTRGRIVTYGRGELATVRALDVTVDGHGQPSYTLLTPEGSARVSLQFIGEVQVYNSLAAAAVGREAGLPVEEIAARLAQALPRSRWRMETTTRADGVTVVNDAYNANPHSMRHSLNALASMARGRDQRAVAVLGRMNELGEDAQKAHEELGRYAAGLDLDQIILVGGDEAGWMQQGVSNGGGRAVHLPDQDAVLHLLRTTLRSGDVVLVKASRGVQLQLVAEALLQPNPESADA